MRYVVVAAAIQNDGSVVETGRPWIIVWPDDLKAGEVYLFAGGRMGGPKLCRVLGIVR